MLREQKWVWRKRAWYAGALLLAGIPVAGYYLTADPILAYDGARVVGVMSGVAVAALAAIRALFQYHENSYYLRVQRSMSFWQRANEPPVLEHLTKVRKFLDCDPEDVELRRELEALASGDIENRGDEVESLKFVLDFYDAACTGVLSPACDEYEMWTYLGDHMVASYMRLYPFVLRFRDRHGRQDVWDCFTGLVVQWVDRNAEYMDLWHRRMRARDAYPPVRRSLNHKQLTLGFERAPPSTS
jgi:hypothetical protein